MQISLNEVTIEGMIREIEELEDSYAEALKDNMDAISLSAFWSHIKDLKKQLAHRMNSEL